MNPAWIQVGATGDVSNDFGETGKLTSTRFTTINSMIRVILEKLAKIIITTSDLISVGH